MSGLRPRFGLDVVPDGAVASYGVRLIVKQDGYVDFVPDRQGAEGPDEARAAILARLGEVLPPSELREVIGGLLRDHRMMTREREDFVLHMDDELVVVANTQASAGYCYVTAWMVAPTTYTLTLTREQAEDLLSAVRSAVELSGDEDKRIARAPESDGYTDEDVEYARAFTSRLAATRDLLLSLLPEEVVTE